MSHGQKTAIFVGIALSIDLGLFGKLKNIIVKQKKNPILNQTQDILNSNKLFVIIWITQELWLGQDIQTMTDFANGSIM